MFNVEGKVSMLRGDLLCPPKFHFLQRNETSVSNITVATTSTIPMAVALSSALS